MRLLHHVQHASTRVPRYLAPTTLEEALAARAELGRRCRPVAGGTDLLVELDRGGHGDLEVLLDVSRIAGFAEVEDQGDVIRLAGGATHHDVVASEVCQRHALPLAQACLEVGSPPLRNRATVAGNLVTASPANDTISALFALEASVELTSVRGTRTVPVTEFVTGFRTVDLADDELVTALVVPKTTARQRGVFVKAGLRRAQAISVVHLSALVTFGDDDVVEEARLALGCVAATVILAPAVDLALRGRRLDDASIADAVRLAAEASTPIDDLRGTAEYRLALVETMTERAFRAIADGTSSARWPAAPPLLRTHSYEPSVAERMLDVGPDDEITVHVNGADLTGAGAVGVNLLDWLRSVGVHGVKEGCAEGECGACAVHLDGEVVMSCLVPAARAHGCTVVTVEGVGNGDVAPIQEAFMHTGAVQCGFCTPGFVMSSAALLDEFGQPSREQILAGLAGNLCRCTGYRSIVDAVERAAGRKETTP